MANARVQQEVARETELVLKEDRPHVALAPVVEIAEIGILVVQLLVLPRVEPVLPAEDQLVAMADRPHVLRVERPPVTALQVPLHDTVIGIGTGIPVAVIRDREVDAGEVGEGMIEFRDGERVAVVRGEPRVVERGLERSRGHFLPPPLDAGFETPSLIRQLAEGVGGAIAIETRRDAVVGRG